jgi:5-(carboxyamino)imidazole ribonucleotide synthase
MLTEPGQANAIWQDLGAQPLIAEQCMDFSREVSLISVRNQQGDIRYYPLSENLHRTGMLVKSQTRRDDSLQSDAEAYVERVLSELNYVGVLGFEFFVCDEKLVANEIAPRVHNSGHWTIEGAATSQFENHLRAILDIPLGSTKALGDCTMYNLVGTMPDSKTVMGLENARLHDYGKLPRANRKLGHITLCDPTPENLTAIERIISAGTRP